jgi:hypothetical protein
MVARVARRMAGFVCGDSQKGVDELSRLGRYQWSDGRNAIR